MNNRAADPLNPRIKVVELSKLGKDWNVKLQNHDEQNEGCVILNCTPRIIKIDRYYLEKWHQSDMYIRPVSAYKRQLVYGTRTKYAGVLTRYFGQDVNNRPIFKVDKDMLEVVVALCEQYVAQFAVIIQKNVRGYLSRRRFNRKRIVLERELLALPPAAIVSSFPGGADYLNVAASYLRNCSYNNVFHDAQ